MQRRTSKFKAFDPDPEAPNKLCDHPDCDEAAGYRAPKGRDNLRNYYWFCLEHVRQYNSKWDFYKGMTPGQIEAQLRADTSWQRPSWKLGSIGGAAKPNFTIDDLDDPHDLLREHRNARRTKKPVEKIKEPIKQALATLNLVWPTTLEDVKIRYRHLARRYHPDANIGDKKAEEHFKAVGTAYTTLKEHFSSSSS
ncbi:DnaJ domain-containing protein [Aristophania vespae]|uniref:DnaJ domain-containing protein n=1 Tax=Aristophania vespae TaxID=2697033 RepID=A0A6P1NJ40_9PROT|nr:DnaJ domain-containing protein [Aristophania vespae]QHI95682.1 DnaJ domain-containing protein [Aristophania vespae]UMM63369.1 Chaperone protein DnaJ [Aristophania vespae]